MPVAGSAMAGERMVVVPPSMSKSPAAAPARRPVTRSLTPLTVVPSCLAPPEVVAAGSPRSHRPVVAVSVPSGLTRPALARLEVVEEDGDRRGRRLPPSAASPVTTRAKGCGPLGTLNGRTVTV